MTDLERYKKALEEIEHYSGDLTFGCQQIARLALHPEILTQLCGTCVHYPGKTEEYPEGDYGICNVNGDLTHADHQGCYYEPSRWKG